MVSDESEKEVEEVLPKLKRKPLKRGKKVSKVSRKQQSIQATILSEENVAENLSKRSMSITPIFIHQTYIKLCLLLSFFREVSYVQ